MEDRVISLKKDRVISLSKKTKKTDGTELDESIKSIFTGLSWGKVIKRSPDIKSTEVERKVTYTGNWLQRALRIGPCNVEEIEHEEILQRGYVQVQDVDLDSSVICYSKEKEIIDIVYYGHKVNSFCKHYGDDTKGGGNKDEDNEMIQIELSKCPKKTEYISIILNSYSHDKFDELDYVKMRIYGSDMNAPAGNKINNLQTFAEYKIDNNPEFKGKEALVLGVFYRDGSEWKFKAIGTSSSEKNISDIAKGSSRRALDNI